MTTVNIDKAFFTQDKKYLYVSLVKPRFINLKNIEIVELSVDLINEILNEYYGSDTNTNTNKRLYVINFDLAIVERSWKSVILNRFIRMVLKQRNHTSLLIVDPCFPNTNYFNFNKSTCPTIYERDHDKFDEIF